MKFADKLKRLREERHMTQLDVVRAMGINPDTGKNYLTLRAYMAYEQKNVRPRHREIYDRLAEVFECDKEYLILDGDNNFAISVFAGLVTAAIGVPLSLGISALIAPMGAQLFGASSLLATRCIFGAGSVAGAFNGILNNYETREKKEAKAKELIDRIENDQKAFSADALRIIQKSLSKAEINYRLGDAKNTNQMITKPDDILLLDDKSIKEWWLVYWAKSEFDDEKTYKSTAYLFIQNFITCGIDKNRKISIIVDNEGLYNAITSYKENIGLYANFTTILINRDRQEIEKEDVIAICEGYEKKKILFGGNKNV